MNPLKSYKIPFQGLKEGNHLYQFDINRNFFQAKESEVEDGSITVDLNLDRRPSMLVLDFEIAGTVKVACDRCLNDINLPIQTSKELLVKFADEAKEEMEIIFLEHGTNVLDVSDFIYESIMLEIPLKKVKDCAAEDYKDCNMKVLSFLQQEEEEVEAEEKENPLARALKDINFNN